jgi:lambda family phage portal protein
VLDPLSSFSAIVAPSGSREIAPARAQRPQAPHAVRRITSKYDAAKTTDENRRGWADADGMSARSANSRDVRYRLRTRARYEVANNSYAYGIVDTLANDTIGTGPRLQMRTEDAEANRAIETSWEDWACEVRLDEKLRTMRKSKVVDGEAFALLVTNPRLRHPIQLDLRLVEADQISTPWLNPIDPQQVDGIRYDDHGNPIQYDMLKSHPGDFYQLGLLFDAIDASRMIHWFRPDRPGQCRGIPEITPALPLFSQLRRYTLAVLAAAETAADFAALLESELPPDTTDPAQFEPFDTLEIERRVMTTLPAGWKMSQFKAEQPTTTHDAFTNKILNEIARCLNMPFNIAAGNSSSYNYASGRLDHQTYYKSIGVEQWSGERVVLYRVLMAWIEEAWLATDLIPDGPARLGGWPHQWMWGGWEHVDPAKEALAQQIRLANLTTTRADEYARRGQDWETQLRQIAKENALMAELGIIPAAATNQPTNQPAFQPDEGGGDVPQDTND